MRSMKRLVAATCAIASAATATFVLVFPTSPDTRAAGAPNSVIFFHPDGMGTNHWKAVRNHTVGPDGELNWDRLPQVAIYTGHMSDGLTASSHGGATVHAFGVRVQTDSFGMDGDRPLTALSGQNMSIMREAQAAGRAVGLVNTGTITEPGTGVFVASTVNRENHQEIARLILEAQPNVILGGGEQWFLPRGTQGRHGEGAREDGLNLVERARALGYTVVFTREELLNLPANTTRVLGLFSSNHTFNDRTEEELRQANLPLFNPNTPTIAEMTQVALNILSREPRGFFLVAEDEATDNFGNRNNAMGTLEAGRRSDEAIGVISRFISGNPNTLMLTTADSDAGGMQLVGPRPGQPIAEGQPVPANDRNGAPLDGVEGTGGMAFMSAPDRTGRRLPFAISWASLSDTSGGILVRAQGHDSQMVNGTVDSTDVYRIKYRVMFGRSLD